MKKMLLALMISSCAFAPALPIRSHNSPASHYTFLTTQADTLLTVAQKIIDQLISGNSNRKLRSDLKKVMRDIHYVLTQLMLYKKQMSINRSQTLVLIIKMLNKAQKALAHLNCFQ